jgi:NADPH-dependent curcumin reductase CurA
VESDFELVETDPPAPRDGQVLVKVRFLSLDPYMRGRMDDARSYAPSQELGQVMVGGTAGEVVESRHPAFQAGDAVVGMGGWQELFLSDGQGLRKVDAATLPLSAHLGPAGMPGVTAWYGLDRVGQPRAGETALVTAAAGAVGSVAGQLARLRGCRAVGVAGGPAKCAHVVGDLGFDACVDYRAPDFREALKAACPSGVDFVFENVGGPVLDAALARMNPFGRVALCGLVAGYQGGEIPIRGVRLLLVNRVRLQGFIVSDHLDLWPQAIRELAGLLASGKLRYRETVADGIESAPRAFVGMLRGENLGKQLVRVS